MVKYALNFLMRYKPLFFHALLSFLKCKKPFGSTSLHWPYLPAYPTWHAKVSLLIPASLETVERAKLYICLVTCQSN